MMQIISLSLTTETYSATDMPDAKVGERRWAYHATYGWQLYRLVYNPTAGTLAANRFVAFATTSSINVDVAADNALARNCALPQIAIPTLRYAWCVVRGDALALGDAAITAGNALTVESSAAAVAGAVDDTAVAGLEHALVGIARATIAAAGTLRIEVTCD